MKKVIIATLLFTMLHSCMGCSDSQSDMEPIPVPQEEYMASDMVIYEAKLLQKSEMRKDIVIELSYKGFG